VRKSLAIETTFAQHLSCEKECESAIELLYEKLLFRVEKHQHMVISKQVLHLNLMTLRKRRYINRVMSVLKMPLRNYS